jgi:hypothetical protein
VSFLPQNWPFQRTLFEIHFRSILQKTILRFEEIASNFLKEKCSEKKSHCSEHKQIKNNPNQKNQAYKNRELEECFPKNVGFFIHFPQIIPKLASLFLYSLKFLNCSKQLFFVFLLLEKRKQVNFLCKSFFFLRKKDFSD